MMTNVSKRNAECLKAEWQIFEANQEKKLIVERKCQMVRLLGTCLIAINHAICRKSRTVRQFSPLGGLQQAKTSLDKQNKTIKLRYLILSWLAASTKIQKLRAYDSFAELTML